MRCFFLAPKMNKKIKMRILIHSQHPLLNSIFIKSEYKQQNNMELSVSSLKSLKEFTRFDCLKDRPEPGVYKDTH